jgi:hypothetical protein
MIGCWLSLLVIFVAGTAFGWTIRGQFDEKCPIELKPSTETPSKDVAESPPMRRHILRPHEQGEE